MSIIFDIHWTIIYSSMHTQACIHGRTAIRTETCGPNCTGRIITTGAAGASAENAFRVVREPCDLQGPQSTSVPCTRSAQLSHVVRLLLCPTGDQGRRVARPSQGESRGEEQSPGCSPFVLASSSHVYLCHIPSAASSYTYPPHSQLSNTFSASPLLRFTLCQYLTRGCHFCP